MTAQKGKDLLLKLDISNTGNFVTVAGLRTKSLRFNASPVEITDSESAGMWRELLNGSGLKTASVSGSGIFKDAQSDEEIRSQFFNALVTPWQITLPDFGTIEGAFQIVTLEFRGEYNGEISFEMELQSAGPISFMAAS